MPFALSAFVRTTTLLLVTSAGLALAEIPKPTDAPKPLSPAESAKKFRLPAGFRMDLIAAEPLIADPACMTFDERGRLFVGELHGYNMEGEVDRLELNKTGKLDKVIRRVRIEGELLDRAREQTFGRIKLLSDTNGDGQMDESILFADNLPPCYGLTAARGGIIAVCPPEVIFLADRDGDGKAEVRETLYRGFTMEVLERGINNPRWCADNWIYVGAGDRPGKITGPHFEGDVWAGFSDFRVKADGTAVEPVTGTVGTFGLAVTEFGDRFSASGGTPGLYALPLDHHYLTRNPFVATPSGRHSSVHYSRCYPTSRPHPWRTKRAEDPRWVKFYGKRETSTGYYTAGCGNEIYNASLFGDDFRGNFFSCEPSQNFVHRILLERNGAGYKGSRPAGTEKSEFLTSDDTWFRPNNLHCAPDGGLYIVDMYREIIEDYSAIPRHLQQQYGLMGGSDRGRLWRLMPEKAEPRDLVDLTKESNESLAKLTDDADMWWRLAAQRLLIERGGEDATKAALDQLTKAETAQGRLHALYTLDGLDALKADQVMQALADAHYGVRTAALKMSEKWLAENDVLMSIVSGMTDDSDPRVRLQLAMTLGEVKDERATAALLKLAQQRGNERWMAAAVLSSVNDTALEVFIALCKPGAMTENSKAILGPLAATLGARRNSEEIAQALHLLLAKDADLQKECLQGLSTGLARGITAIATPRDEWISVKELLKSDHEEIRALAVKLGAQVRLTDAPEIRAAYAKAAEEALDAGRRHRERIAAIRLLSGAPFDVLAPCVDELLEPQQPPVIQLAAIAALGECEDEQVGAALLDKWEGYTPNLRKATIAALFGRTNRLTALLDSVEEGRVRASQIDAFHREQIFSIDENGIAARAKKLLADMQDDAEFAKRVAKYTAALAAPREPSLGHEVFKKNCMVCHRINGEGFQVGPEIAGAINRSDESILMDMLDPGRKIASGFESYVIRTVDGRIVSGVLVADSATSVSLKRDKGEVDTVLRKNIEEMKASEQSLMPANFHEVVTPKETADLLAWIRQVLSPMSEKAPE